jgi:hypothetical protein
MMRRAAFFVFAMGLATPSVAAADTAEERRAEQLFNDGQVAFEAGDFRRAATSFEAAYAAKRHPAVLWNAARSWQRAGEELHAAIDFDRYLRGSALDAPHRDEATKNLAELLKHIGRVQLRAVGVKKVMLDGEPWSEPTAFVAPGEHVATAEDDAGRSVRKVFSARAGETLSVVVSAEPKPEPKVETPPPKEDPQREEAPPPARRPLSPWIVVAGSVLAVAGGTVTALSALETLNKAHTFDGEPTQANYDAGFASQARTNVALAVTGGIVVLTVAAAVFLVDWGKSGPKSSREAGWR